MSTQRSGSNIVLPATGWKDYVADLTNAKAVGQAQPNWSQFNGTGIYAWQFSASAMNELWASFHINHDYKPGSNIYPHVHWCPTNTNTGVVRWGFEYVVARGHNQQAFGSSSTVYVEQAATGTSYMHQIAEFADGQAFNTYLEPDSLLLFRIFRDAAHINDTYNAVCFGLYLDLHVQSDRDVTTTKAPNWDT